MFRNDLSLRKDHCSSSEKLKTAPHLPTGHGTCSAAAVAGMARTAPGPPAAEVTMASLPPNWTSEAGNEAEGTYTTRRLPVCNQQTLAEMEAQGVPRCCTEATAYLHRHFGVDQNCVCVTLLQMYDWLHARVLLCTVRRQMMFDLPYIPQGFILESKARKDVPHSDCGRVHHEQQHLRSDCNHDPEARKSHRQYQFLYKQHCRCAHCRGAALQCRPANESTWG